MQDVRDSTAAVCNPGSAELCWPLSFQSSCSSEYLRKLNVVLGHPKLNGFFNCLQVEGLRPGREYVVRVRACNSRGQGPWSTPVSAETLPAPPAAPSAPVVSQRTASWLRCRWDAPAEDNGAAVLHYRFPPLLPCNAPKEMDPDTLITTCQVAHRYSNVWNASSTCCVTQ